MDNLSEICVIRFHNRLKIKEISLFRGAIIALIDGGNELFHNHIESGYRYAYPLIQYKCIDDRAVIVCINEATDLMYRNLSSIEQEIVLGGRTVHLSLDVVERSVLNMDILSDKIRYSLKNWLPLNSKNYSVYIQIESLREKIMFLEKILVANILSMAKGLGITFAKQILCEIIDIESIYQIKRKGVMLMAFDIIFKTNINLLDYVGLGKSVSVGYGVIKKITN